MNDEVYYITDDLETRKIGLINQLFIEPADQEYISARWAFNNGMFYSCYTQSAQAIEKYLKAVLLFQDIDTKPYRHDLVRLWEVIKQFDNTNLLPGKFSWPEAQSESGLLFSGKSSDEFIKYLSVFGSPDNRYGSYGIHLDGSIIFAIDTICFSIRRLIRMSNNCSCDLYEHNRNHYLGQSEITEIQDWMLSPVLLLERLATGSLFHAGEKKELQHIFKNMNFAFAPNYAESTESFGGYIYQGFPIQNWLIRHRELDKSEQNQAIIDELEDWVNSHIFISKQVKSNL